MSDADALEQYLESIELMPWRKLALWEKEHVVRAMRLMAAEVRLLREMKAEVREFTEGGLYEDAAHHKQWYLEQIANIVGFKPSDNDPWEEGIAP